jgi:ABC-type phosphate transport system substrate-binding protein
VIARATARAIACAAALLTGGCGETVPQRSAEPSLAGPIVFDGAPDVSAPSAFAAEEFVRFHPRVRARIDRSGEAVALQRLCRGEVDVVHATRRPPSCPGGGPQLRAATVAVDALAVVAHPAARWPRCLAVAEVRRLLAAASPAVRVIGADRARGYGPLRSRKGEGAPLFPPDDAQIVRAVMRDRAAIGFVGAGVLRRHGAGVRSVSIAEAGTCTAPTPSRIRAGAYGALSRSVLLVFRADVVRSPRTHAFLRFAVSSSEAIADAALLVPARADDRRRAAQAVA